MIDFHIKRTCMEDENKIEDEFIYNYKCDKCGAMKEVKIKVLKNSTSFDYIKPRVTKNFCPNGHQVILPVGKYQAVGNELFLFKL